MGIPGLTSYVNTLPFGEQKVWEPYDLHDTNLIIDGCGLYYYIYASNEMNTKCGGEYNELQNKVKEFFRKLQSNNIVPYVVFDGIMNRDGKKFSTVMRRKKECITRMKQLWTTRRPGYQMVRPQLAEMAILQVLQEMKVPYAIADFEADSEIALLANKLNAPVLANDSDFFIYNVKCGYIPFEHYDLSGPSIRVRKFSFNGFATHLGIDLEMSPLLASLIGNDYISNTMLTPFSKHIQLLVNSSQLTAGSRNCKVPTIAQFLSNYESVSAAFEAVVDMFPQNSKPLFEKALRLSIEEYQRPQSNLIGYFSSGELGSNMRTYNGEPIPHWLIKLYREGLFAPEGLACLCNRKLFLRTQSEDVSKPSAQMCAQSLRWYYYALVMNCEITATVVTESQSKAGMLSRVAGQAKLRMSYDTRKLEAVSMVKDSDCHDISPLSTTNGHSKPSKRPDNTKTYLEFDYFHQGYAREPGLQYKTDSSPGRPIETDNTRLLVTDYHPINVRQLASAPQQQGHIPSYYILPETDYTTMVSNSNQYFAETTSPYLPAMRYSNIGTKFDHLSIEDQTCETTEPRSSAATTFITNKGGNMNEVTSSKDTPVGDHSKLVVMRTAARVHENTVGEIHSSSNFDHIMNESFTTQATPTNDLVTYNKQSTEEIIVIELMREGSTLVPKKVNLRVEVPESIIKIHHIPKMSDDVKKSHILTLLDCNQSFIRDLPVKYQLIVSAFRYWIIHSEAKGAHLAAVLVHYVGERPSSFPSKSKRNHHVSVQAVHGFAQWQIVVYWVQRLNSLFSFQFPPLQVAKLYNGIRVCLLYERLEVLGFKFAESIVDNTKVNLYRQLYDAVTKDLPHDCQFNQSRGKLKKESRKCVEGKEMRSEKESLKGNKFALLCGESDSDED